MSDPRMNRTDGCPNCVEGYHRPTNVEPSPEGYGFIAWYNCSNCGHCWWTNWSDTMIDWTQGGR